MILVAGGTGVLGSAVVERLLVQRRPVRLLTRNPERAGRWRGRLEVAQGDLRDPEALRRACNGATHVITTANAFSGRGAESVAAVDEQGNRNLVNAAVAARVRQFVFTSALLSEAYRSIDFFAAKFHIEAYLRQSGLTWTILRPAAFMETWAAIIGEPLVRTGATTIFGAGETPVNFVAVDNVAEVAVLSLDRADALNAVVDIVGPENLTLTQVADAFERVTGRRGKRKHLPVAIMRLLAPLVRPFNPVFARQVKAGAIIATKPQILDPAAMLERFPIRLVTLDEWIRNRFGASS